MASKTKDTDKDGVPDINDPAPTNPLIPARSDLTGLFAKLNATGINVPVTNNAGKIFINTAGMDPETARETRRAYYGNSNYTFDPTGAVPGGSQSTYTSGGGGGGGYSGPTTSIQKQVTQYTLQQVKGLANSAFQAAIGREATADELKKFTAALNKEEKANATKTVSTSTPKGHTVSTTSKTTGGMDEQQFAKDQAKLNPEYAPYQQATTYFDAMINSLSGPVGRGI